jgi:hypothetical protein
MLPITDQTSVRALRERLTTLKLSDGIGDRSAFCFIHSALKGGAGPGSRFDFVLGLAATEEEFFAALIRVSPETRGWVPGWVLIRRKRQGRGANRPSKSGAAGGTQGAEVSTSSPADDGVAASDPNFNSPFIACLMRTAESEMSRLAVGDPTLVSCLACGAALAVAGPAGGYVMAPACVLCALTVGVFFTYCAVQASQGLL